MYFHGYKMESKYPEEYVWWSKGLRGTKFDTEHWVLTETQNLVRLSPLYNAPLGSLSNIEKPRPVYFRESLEILSMSLCSQDSQYWVRYISHPTQILLYMKIFQNPVLVSVPFHHHDNQGYFQRSQPVTNIFPVNSKTWDFRTLICFYEFWNLVTADTNP